MSANGLTATTALGSPGARIKFLRRSKDLTQETLARKLYTTQPTVARWEKDEFVPHRSSQVLLAEALGTTREFLFGEAA